MAERNYNQCPRCGNIQGNELETKLPPMPKDAKLDDLIPPVPITATCASCGFRWQFVHPPSISAQQAHHVSPPKGEERG